MSNKHPIERATAAPEEAEVTVPDRNAPHRVPHDAEGKPDLGRLIRRYGSYDRVPAEAWTAYDEAMRRFLEARPGRVLTGSPRR